MKHKYTLEDSLKLGWDGIKVSSYSEKHDFANASAAMFEVTKKHGKVKSLTSDRVYYVIEGQGEFEIGKEKIKVKATDVIIVPKNTEYDYSGKMKLFLVHTPAYDKNNEITIAEDLKEETVDYSKYFKNKL